METKETSLDEYMARQYAQRQWYDSESEAWICESDELEGCVAHGATPEEAAANFKAAKRVWFRAALSSGMLIPEPRSVGASRPQFSGRMLLRLPKDLHEILARRAASQNVSLNQYATVALARAVGADEVRDELEVLAVRYRQIAHSHMNQVWAWVRASGATRRWTTEEKVPLAAASTYFEVVSRKSAEPKAFDLSSTVADMYGKKATEETRH